MAITAREVENISVQMLDHDPDKDPGGRQIVLQNAALIERLRDQFPGWVTRKIVNHSGGPGSRRWPIAIVRFLYAPSTPGNAEQRAPCDEVIACVWRVGSSSTQKLPQLVLSAAICDDRGFQPKKIAADAIEKLRREVVKHWQEAELASELMLFDPEELEKRLDSRLNAARKGLLDKWKVDGFPSGLPPEAPRTEQLLFDVDYARTSSVSSGNRETYQRLRSLIAPRVVDDAGALPDLAEDSGAWLGRLALFLRPAPFYLGYALYRLQRSWPVEGQASAAVKNGYVVAPDHASDDQEAAGDGGAPEQPFAILDGTSPPIHRLNGLLQDKRQITAETALDYLKFFCEFVHGENGAFYLLEGSDDLWWQDEAAVDADRRSLLLRSMQVPVLAEPRGEQRADDEAFHCVATVHYGRDVFLAEFDVQRTGTIELNQDHPLVRELPVHPHQWDQQARLLTPGDLDDKSHQ